MNETELAAFKMALKDENYHVRRAAIEKLGWSGCSREQETLERNLNSQKAISILIDALTDSDNYVQLLAAEALTFADSNFQQVSAFTIMKTLIDVSASKERELILADRSDDTSYYKGEDDLTIAEAANFVIADLGGYLSESTSEVIQLFTNPDSEYRDAVAYALSFMLYDNEPAFIQALADKNKLVRLGVIDALLALGEDEDLYREMKAVLPALVKASEDEDNQVREAASKLLKSLESFSA